MPSLNSMGFEVEEIDKYYFEISAIPLTLGELKIEDFVQDMVRDIPLLDKKPSEFVNEKLCQHACKHAIKGGDSISKDECAYLIEQVRKGVMLCPHGRPITLALSRREFEKMFKRIV